MTPAACGRSRDSQCRGELTTLRCQVEGCAFAVTFCDGHRGRWIVQAFGGHKQLHRPRAASGARDNGKRLWRCRCGELLMDRQLGDHMSEVHGVLSIAS